MKQPDALKSNVEVGKKWVKPVNWEGVFWVIILPVLGLFAATFTPLRKETAIWAITYHVTTGIGITAGSSTLRIIVMALVQDSTDNVDQAITGYGHIEPTPPIFL